MILFLIKKSPENFLRIQSILWLVCFVIFWVCIALSERLDEKLSLKNATLRQKAMIVFNILILIIYASRLNIDVIKERF